MSLISQIPDNQRSQNLSRFLSVAAKTADYRELKCSERIGRIERRFKRPLLSLFSNTLTLASIQIRLHVTEAAGNSSYLYFETGFCICNLTEHYCDKIDS